MGIGRPLGGVSSHCLSITDPNGGDGGELSRFEDFLESLLKKLSKGSRVNPQKADKLIPINNLFVGSFLASLINPEAGNALGGRDGLHDAFGHFAMGRGVDRHGEWANALAIMSLVDHPDFDATPAERNAIKQSWFGEYGLYFVTNFNEEVTIEPTTLWGAIANYAGNFDDILNILDDSPH